MIRQRKSKEKQGTSASKEASDKLKMCRGGAVFVMNAFRHIFKTGSSCLCEVFACGRERQEGVCTVNFQMKHMALCLCKNPPGIQLMPPG